MKEKVDIVLLQETKWEEVQQQDCRAIWGADEVESIAKDAVARSGGLLCLWNKSVFADEVESIAKDAVARSGGLLCLWNKSVFAKEITIVGDGFVGVKGIWRPNKIQCSFFNIYAQVAYKRKYRCGTICRMPFHPCGVEFV
ncbi:hypothetical protein SLE2022_262480 [Rubroshorea leprosula]